MKQQNSNMGASLSKGALTWKENRIRICAWLLSVLIGIGAAFGCWWLFSGSRALPVVSPAEEIILPTNPYEIDPVLESVDFSKELSDFTAKNRDCVAWLYIPGTDINNEVVQSWDNDYYLRRTSMGVYYSEHGCYFSDYRNTIRKGQTPKRNTIIYGHNINDDGTFFAQLLQYTDWEHFAKYPYIYLQTAEELHVYRIVAAYYTATDFYYIDTKANDTEWAYILSESEKRSEFHTGLKLPVEGSYLTLSTCCYKYKTSWGSRRRDQRFVILAMEIAPSKPPKYTFPVVNPSIKAPY